MASNIPMKPDIQVGDQMRSRDGSQLFECTAIVPYRRVDGNMTKLAVLASNCADCGARFEFKVSTRVSKISLNRRCDLHKAPLRRVRSGVGPAKVRQMGPATP